MRLALLGAGPWAMTHARTLARMRGVELDTVLSSRPRAAGFGARHWCRNFSDVDWARMDGAIVATAAASHVRLARALIESGVPALVEKPLALCPRDALRLEAGARRRRTLVMVGLVHQFSEAFETLAAGVRAEGGPLSIRACGGNRGPYRSNCTALWDYGPHDAAMVLSLLAGARRARASALVVDRVEQRQDGNGGVSTEARLRTHEGIPVQLHFGSAMAEKQRWLEVATAQAVWRYDDLAQARLQRSANGHTESLPLPGAWPLTRMLERFRASIRSGRRRDDSLTLGVQSTLLLARIEAAARNPH